jgi:transcriptional regulator with XRE-family HTH domain
VSHLGDYFRKRRVEKKLTFGQLAELLGYKNLTRGANRIQAFEGGGKAHPDLLGKLAEVLEVGPDDIRQRVAEDYWDWMAWAKEPIRPYVIVRLMACVYQRVQLPDEALDPEASEAFAANVASERKFKVCLVLSRRVSVWFDATGKEYGRTEATPEMPCEPYAMIGGRKVQFEFDKGVTLRPIDEPGG